MPMPRDIPVIDTLMGLAPSTRASGSRHAASPLFRNDPGSDFPAGYLFKNRPEMEASADAIGDTLRLMDSYNIERALIVVKDDETREAVVGHRDRFLGHILVDPHDGAEAVRNLVRVHEDIGLVAAACFPVGHNPTVPIDDPSMYPIYAKCVELDLPMFVNAGIPGPRVPYEAQYAGRVDEVCWFFPDLRLILRHGGEPWAGLAVKLLLKWPNLYYSTSGFAPKYYPREIIDFANSRGADKIIYAGYFPSGLSLDRLFGELDDLPLRDAVWPRFLRENAIRVLKL